MSDLAGKHFKIALLNRCTELKYSIIKEVKEDTITMSHQIETIKKET